MRLSKVDYYFQDNFNRFGNLQIALIKWYCIWIVVDSCHRLIAVWNPYYWRSMRIKVSYEILRRQTVVSQPFVPD